MIWSLGLENTVIIGGIRSQEAWNLKFFQNDPKDKLFYYYVNDMLSFN